MAENIFLLIFKSMRPAQWSKNLIMFAGIVFSKNLLNTELFSMVFFSFGIFCALSSATYLVNDIADYQNDRKNKLKKQRPIASGKLDRGYAAFIAGILVVFSLMVAWNFGMKFFLMCILFLSLQIMYSLVLKHIVILDVLSISFGFILRVIAGGIIISVAISNWLLICTTLISLLLALDKRRHELQKITEIHQRRKVLEYYDLPILDQMTSVVTASILLSYILYTISEETISHLGTDNLIYTIPFVLFGIFRYIFLSHKTEAAGSLENLYIDRPFVLNIILWVLAVVAILYLK